MCYDVASGPISWFGGLSVLPDVKKLYCDHINIIDDYVDMIAYLKWISLN